MNFVELVHSLLEDPSERKYFFQVIQHSLLNVLLYFPLAEQEMLFLDFHYDMSEQIEITNYC